MTSTHLGAFEAHRSTVRRRTMPGGAIRALSGAIRRAASGYGEWRRTRHAIEELQRLDTRTLRDIGLMPGDVDPANIRATLNRASGF